jgi:hypothetical protein
VSWSELPVEEVANLKSFKMVFAVMALATITSISSVPSLPLIAWVLCSLAIVQSLSTTYSCSRKLQLAWNSSSDA